MYMSKMNTFVSELLMEMDAPLLQPACDVNGI